jgi:hypothetical protein
VTAYNPDHDMTPAQLDAFTAAMAEPGQDQPAPRTFANGAPMHLPAQPTVAAQAAAALALEDSAHDTHCTCTQAAEQSDEDAAADLVASARDSYDAACTAVEYLAGIVSDTVCQYAAAMMERQHAAAVLAAAELAQADLIAPRG